MLTIVDFLERTAQITPQATYVVYRGRHFSFNEINKWANRLANGLLSVGYKPDDKIGLICSNRPGFLAAYFGILKLGAIPVVLSTGGTVRDLVHELGNSEAVGLFVYEGLDNTDFINTVLTAQKSLAFLRHIWLVPPTIEEASFVSSFPSLADLAENCSDRFTAIRKDPHSTAQILYTSGSTGRAKGIELTHYNLSAMIEINKQISDRRDTRIRLTIASLYHITGQIFAIGLAAACGECLVLVERFDPEEILRTIATERCTHLLCMPSYYKDILDYAPCSLDDLVRKELRFCASGGEPLPRTWGEEFKNRFGLPIVTGYGLTETTGIVTWNNATDGKLARGSAGLPVPKVTVQITDQDNQPVSTGSQGELWIKSPGNMRGYHKLPQETEKAFCQGWLKTGDLGYKDEDGHVMITGRSSGLIIRAGTNISPIEVEDVLCEHPLVAQAAAFAIPHPRLGQDVKTMIVAKPGCHLTAEDIRSWIIGRLPESKHPGIVEITTSLPLTSTGKVARALLH